MSPTATASRAYTNDFQKFVSNDTCRTARLPVTVGIRGGEGRAEVSVHNHGPPIPAEHLPGLFEPFQRGLRPGALDGSIGLGLYIVRQVALGHGGDVRVRSTAEEGTTFVLELPADGAPVSPDAPAQDPEGGASASSRFR